jgi:type I restriction enzyme, S subunit
MKTVQKIPKDWEKKKIKQFTDVTSGGTPSTIISEYWGGDLLWMNSGELNKKKIYDVKGRITKKGMNKSATKQIPEKSVLIGLAGQGKTRGTVAINYVKLCINQSVGAILPSDDCIPEFIYYNLDHRYEELRNMSTGSSGRGGLNLTIIKNIEVLFPSTVQEQIKISRILLDIDTLIISLETLIEKKKNVLSGTMQKLLTEKKRLNGFNRKWKFDIIKNHTTITTGSKNTQDKMDNGLYPFFVRSQKIEKINSFSHHGEAVLTAGDGVGTGKVFHYINGKFDVHQRVYQISNFSENLDGYFFYLYFKNHFFKRIMSMNAKSSVDSVRMNMISEMMIPLPEKEEQIEIAKVLSHMENEIKILEIKQKKNIMIKEGMMQKLLTGEIRIK